jgi:2-oxoglutarate dehydrogenase complex dehydrogenase (E1) component-like enzyme
MIAHSIYVQDRNVSPLECGNFRSIAHSLPRSHCFVHHSHPIVSAVSTSTTTTTNGRVSEAQVLESLRLDSLIRSFQRNGHRLAVLDPLGLKKSADVPELNYKSWGFTDADLDKELFVNSNNSPYIFANKPYQKLRDVIGKLTELYCGKAAVNYTHLLVRKKKKIRMNWR